MKVQNSGWALFARAVNPDQDGITSWDLGFKDGFGKPGLSRKGLHRARFGGAGEHRCVPFKLPRVTGGTDLGILAHPRRSRGNLCGEPCKQGHEGKEYPVHRPRI